MERTGVNFVELRGYIGSMKVSDYERDGYWRVQANISVPVVYMGPDGLESEKTDKVLIVAWGSTAEALAEVREGSWLRVTGVITTRQYKDACRFCCSMVVKYVTEVIVTNFVLL